VDHLCPGCFEQERPVEGESCPLCGYVHDQNRLPLSIPIETKLKGRYVVGRILGEPGGFGVTYLSYDRLQEKRVAIKEYMPREIAGRDTDGVSVVPHSGKGSEEFEYGKEQFLEEAKTLARFDHANIVSVQDFFEDNGTAYLVMEYYEGKPLDQYLADQPDGRMDPEVATEIMLRVLDGLKEIHAKGYLHRDVKPENVYLTKEGRPILIDFGAARQAVGERSRSLSVMMTPGYAPYEQYRRDGDQGPHTDVYGAGATLYRMVTGEKPLPATDRVVEDTLQSPREVNPEVPKGVSRAVMGALAVGNKERLATAERLQERLQGREEKSGGTVQKGTSQKGTGEQKSRREGEQSSGKTPSERDGRSKVGEDSSRVEKRSGDGIGFRKPKKDINNEVEEEKINIKNTNTIFAGKNARKKV
jgi:serine/threonine protein kinase